MKKQVLLLTMMVLPMVASAYDAEIDGIYYEFNFETKTATAANGSKQYIGDIVIPSEVTYNGEKYSVTSIGCDAFYLCKGVTSITIPKSIIEIGNSAFYGCSGLTSVYIEDIVAWCNISFNYYNNDPLSYAKHLYLNGELVKDLTIPNSITIIGTKKFEGCIDLTSVTIPNSVTSIDNAAFAGCSGLTSIDIPNSVTSIGGSAFSGCI